MARQVHAHGLEHVGAGLLADAAQQQAAVVVHRGLVIGGQRLEELLRAPPRHPGRRLGAGVAHRSLRPGAGGEGDDRHEEEEEEEAEMLLLEERSHCELFDAAGVLALWVEMYYSKCAYI